MNSKRPGAYSGQVRRHMAIIIRAETRNRAPWLIRACFRRLTASVLSAFLTGGTLFHGCTAVVRVPGVNVDVNDQGVFVDLLGGWVSVTDDEVHVDLPGILVDVQG